MSEENRPSAPKVGLKDRVLEGWFNGKTGELAKGVRVRATDTVVDVGCGDGAFIGFCARQGAEVVFVDRDEASLATTEARIKDSPAHAYRAILSECDPIPLEDDTGDLVICTEVLEHVADPVSLVRELVRVAKPGAQLMITVPDYRSEKLVATTAPPQYFEAPNHIRIFAPGQLREMLVDAGLEIETEQWVGCFWSMYQTLAWLPGEEDSPVPADEIPDHWTRLWKALQEHPKGGVIRDALNELLPRTHSIVARKSQ